MASSAVARLSSPKRDLISGSSQIIDECISVRYSSHLPTKSFSSSTNKHGIVGRAKRDDVTAVDIPPLAARSRDLHWSCDLPARRVSPSILLLPLPSTDYGPISASAFLESQYSRSFRYLTSVKTDRIQIGTV